MLNDDKNVLLNIRDLVIEFRNKGVKFQAVKGVNFDIYKGEIFGLVGESGSGKTTIGRAIVGVQPLAYGSIYLDNQLVAGQPTSLYNLNKIMLKKINFIESKYSIYCDYVDKIIRILKKNYTDFKNSQKEPDLQTLKNVFAYSLFSVAQKLAKDNLRYVNDIITNFRRINQFITNIHDFIPSISKELESAVLTKNMDVLDIVYRLRDKMSLDLNDLVTVKDKLKNQALKNKNVEILEIFEFLFSKLKLIKENDDRIKRRIKIALRLEEQNFDLSLPTKYKKQLINKYCSQVYVKQNDFVSAYENIKATEPEKVSNLADDIYKKIKKETNQTSNNFIENLDVAIEYRQWTDSKSNLTERQRNSIIELISFLKLPSIDELVKSSYLFSQVSRTEIRNNRKNIQMIFQDPGSSLNERMSVEEVISEGLDNFPELYKSAEAKEDYVESFNKINPNNKISIDQIESPLDVKKHIILKLIKSVGLLPEHLSRYPHEFSGGQKQRIGIARSLALKPKIIIADEPISALDVSIRAQVLNLFQLFKKEYDLTYLFITHDLSVVKFIADRIAVIYHGDIVEMASSDQLFRNPLHPYTKSLLSAIPQPDPDYSFHDKLIVYNPKEEHFDYIFDLPEFVEVEENHFVLANKRELKIISKTLKK